MENVPLSVQSLILVTLLFPFAGFFLLWGGPGLAEARQLVEDAGELVAARRAAPVEVADTKSSEVDVVTAGDSRPAVLGSRPGPPGAPHRRVIPWRTSRATRSFRTFRRAFRG